MGWMWTSLNGEKTRDYLKRRVLEFDGDETKTTVLDMAICRRKVCYAAVQVNEKITGVTYVYAAVILLAYAPKSQYNFGYKDMDETVGPYERDCPKRILKLLSPLHEWEQFIGESGRTWAKEWREDCWAKIAEREAKKSGK